MMARPEEARPWLRIPDPASDRLCGPGRRDHGIESTYPRGWGEYPG